MKLALMILSLLMIWTQAPMAIHRGIEGELYLHNPMPPHETFPLAAVQASAQIPSDTEPLLLRMATNPNYILGTNLNPKLTIAFDPTRNAWDRLTHFYIENAWDRLTHFYIEMAKRHPEETKVLLDELRITIHYPDGTRFGFEEEKK